MRYQQRLIITGMFCRLNFNGNLFIQSQIYQNQEKRATGSDTVVAGTEVSIREILLK